MGWFLKVFQFLPIVLSTVVQVENDLRDKSGSEKKAAALYSLKGAGHIARLADARDADSIDQATQAAGAAIDAVVSIFNHTGTFETAAKPQAPAGLTPEEQKQLEALQAKASGGK
jgi:hypothetical protein